MRKEKLKEKENKMNELECKECNEPTKCSEEAVAVTCSDCTSVPTNENYSWLSDEFNVVVEDSVPELFELDELFEEDGTYIGNEA